MNSEMMEILRKCAAESKQKNAYEDFEKLLAQQLGVLKSLRIISIFILAFSVLAFFMLIVIYFLMAG